MFIILWKSCFFWMLKVFPNSSRSIPMNAFLFTLIVGFFGLISFPRNSHPSFWKLSKTQYSCCGWRSLTKSQFKGTELLCSAYMTAEKSKDNTSRETQSRRIARLQTVCFFVFSYFFLSQSVNRIWKSDVCYGIIYSVYIRETFQCPYYRTLKGLL